jgi:hypothetical protein
MVREKEGAKKRREVVHSRRGLSPVTLGKGVAPSMSAAND